ncbi:MAG: glycine-rich domain-containing protein [Telluria sp.]
MTSNVDFNKIAQLDLDRIKVKLMHESGERWTQEQADSVEFEYRRFLYLMMKFPHEQTSPRVDVDTFWHYHILDTVKYAADCEQAFGFFLHHNPSVALSGEGAEEQHEAYGQRMRELYEATFGASYDSASAAYCSLDPDKIPPGPRVNAAYCSVDPDKLPPGRRATAYCSVDPDKLPPGPRVTATAYCSVDEVPPRIRAKAGTAGRGIDLSALFKTTSMTATAYCSIHPPTGMPTGGTAANRAAYGSTSPAALHPRGAMALA